MQEREHQQRGVRQKAFRRTDGEAEEESSQEAAKKKVMSDPLSQMAKERLDEMNALSKSLTRSDGFLADEEMISVQERTNCNTPSKRKEIVK